MGKSRGGLGHTASLKLLMAFFSALRYWKKADALLDFHRNAHPRARI
ncbi:hypothetical protein [Marinobacterium rhizophilum]|uniref:Uncharacterized protein n=1 Tax=Marinobacterium rhizophilum TaxID=420402 RepID=A0ABY5HD12_9GAMM|nr:hypothetical protein [Marinobacterium rhizophilum]UTW10212.1 hypothetical protein KDW95_12930 [Marinobacterium rhizophilum]